MSPGLQDMGSPGSGIRSFPSPGVKSLTSEEALQERNMDLYYQLQQQKMELMEERDKRRERRMSGITGVSGPSRWTNFAQQRVPISGHTIVRLQEIKRRMGTKVDLFHDSSIFGFERKKWESKLFEKFPLDVSEGFKQHIGRFIKTSSQKRAFLCTVQKKVTEFQLNALIAVIESKIPPFHHVTTFVKRKVWEEIYNMNSLYSLKHYIQQSLREVPRIFLKLTW